VAGVALRGAADAEIRTFRIFAESKLDTGERAFKGEFRGGLSPTKLDDDGLPSDGICGTVEDVCGGYAAGEIAPNRDVVGVEHIGDVHHGGDGHGAFVDTAVNSNVRMAVDDPGRNELAGGINHDRVRRSFQGTPDRGDLSVFDQDVAFVDGAVGNR